MVMSFWESSVNQPLQSFRKEDVLFLQWQDLVKVREESWPVSIHKKPAVTGDIRYFDQN